MHDYGTGGRLEEGSGLLPSKRHDRQCTPQEPGPGLHDEAVGTSLCQCTWDEMWTVLCDDPEDHVARYFPFLSKCIRLLCNPWVIAVSTSGALYNAVDQLLAAIHAHREKLDIWASSAYSASSFALAVGVLLVARAIRGGAFSGDLLENRPDGKSYYEALDVMIKDVVGNVKREKDGGMLVRSCRTFGVDRLRALHVIIDRSRFLRGITIVMMIVAALTACWRFYHHVHAEGRPVLQLLNAIPDLITFFTAFLVVFTMLQVLRTAADLHLAQTSIFISWLRRLRTDKPQSQEAAERLRFAVGEAYLLIAKLFMRSSESWSIPLTAWILLSGSVSFFSGIASLFVDPPDKYYCMVVSAVNFVVCMIPVVMVVYANGHVDQIRMTFLHAKPSDFQAIGGRSEWVQYIREYPVYWYVSGFPMTSSWLLTFISAAISAAAIMIIEQVARDAGVA